ncbi:MAG: site-2 protease family protein [Candidatus Paceibacterota bacterium]
MEIIFFIVILIMSVVVHEVSHGWVAYFLGDGTAKQAGRLTLNPIPHIDPIGSILVPFIMALLPLGIIFGWARPVPYNPYNLRAGKWGPALVAAAGPLSNITVASLCGLIFRLSPALTLTSSAGVLIAWIIVLNLALAIFNLIPVAPLDGSKILFALLPYHLRYIEDFLTRYQLFVILLIIFMAGSFIIGPIVGLFELLTGQSFLALPRLF